MKRSPAHVRLTPFRWLEAEVLERLDCTLVELDRAFLLAPANGELGLRGPRGSLVTCRGQLRKALLRGPELLLGLLQPALLQERAAENELCVPDLVDEVDPVSEKVQGVPSLLLGKLQLARAQMNLGQRRDRLSGVGVASHFERDGERLLEEGMDSSGLPRRNVRPPSVVKSLPVLALSSMSS